MVHPEVTESRWCYICSRQYCKVRIPTISGNVIFLCIFKFKINILDELNTPIKRLNTAHLSSHILHILHLLPVHAATFQGRSFLLQRSSSGCLHLLVPQEENLILFLLTVLITMYHEISHPVSCSSGKAFLTSFNENTNSGSKSSWRLWTAYYMTGIIISTYIGHVI